MFYNSSGLVTIYSTKSGTKTPFKGSSTIIKLGLFENSGATRALELTSIYNPLLVPGDRIDVKLPSQTLETHVCELINMNLGPSSAMTIETRLDRPIPMIGGGKAHGNATSGKGVLDIV